MPSTEKIRAAFDELAGREQTDAQWYDRPVLHIGASAWLLESIALVEATCGDTHATTRTMRSGVEYAVANAAEGATHRTHLAQLRAARAAFAAARATVATDRLDGLVDLVRATTVGA